MEAKRDNKNKGEQDYLLTYPSGVFLAFDPSFWLYDVQERLGEWYRGHAESIKPTLEALRAACLVRGIDLASILAETQVVGVKKYKVGNYLHGGNWRQYAQCEIRHAIRLMFGEERDAEGNPHLGAIAFNLLALDMCETYGLGKDDRIRKSESEGAEPSNSLGKDVEVGRPGEASRETPCAHDWRSDSAGWACQLCPAKIAILDGGVYERTDLDERYSTYWQAARGV